MPRATERRGSRASRNRSGAHGRWLHPGALALVLVLAVTVGAQPTTRHSGKVERVDLERGVLVVDELVAAGQHRRHEFHVGPTTAIVSTARLRSWEMRGPRSYGEVSISLVDVLVGDFVVVDALAEGERELAQRITLVELSRATPARR